jgi:hypothetical protein
MCIARRDGVSGSTNVQGRVVLPTNVKPTHYDLTLEVDFEKFTYDGTVVIEYVEPRYDQGQVKLTMYFQPGGERRHGLRLP